ncbi:232_t:CDS:2, partial [Acaulospora colombiana]
ELMLTVSADRNQNQRQLLGFIELDAPELYDAIGVTKQYELPLIGHENTPGLILRAQILGLDENPNLAPAIESQGSNSSAHNMLQKIVSEARAAFDDFCQYGHMTSLDQAISQFQT